MTLFNIASEFQVLRDLAENDLEFNEETGEIIDNTDIINQLFEEIKLGLEDKLDNCMKLIKELEGSSEILKQEAKRINSKAIAFDNKAKQLKELMKNALVASGQEKLKTFYFSYNIKNSESIEVADVELLPRQFLRIKKEADKKAIKEALQNNILIEGCSIKSSKSLVVR